MIFPSVKSLFSGGRPLPPHPLPAGLPPWRSACMRFSCWARSRSSGRRHALDGDAQYRKNTNRSLNRILLTYGKTMPILFIYVNRSPSGITLMCKKHRNKRRRSESDRPGSFQAAQSAGAAPRCCGEEKRQGRTNTTKRGPPYIGRAAADRPAHAEGAAFDAVPSRLSGRPRGGTDP